MVCSMGNIRLTIRFLTCFKILLDSKMGINHDFGVWSFYGFNFGDNVLKSKISHREIETMNCSNECIFAVNDGSLNFTDNFTIPDFVFQSTFSSAHC